MPQGRRKTPFSGKKKKEQIAAKRQVRKAFPHPTHSGASESNDDLLDNAIGDTVQKINYQSKTNQRGNANRYALQFYKETDKQLKSLKEQGYQQLINATKKDLEIGTNYFDGYDFPIRPKWSYRLSKEELERNENRYFTEYVMKLEQSHAEANRMLSYFELNLETWRQLWRVLELCDILLIIVDIRTPTLMFPPALYDFFTNSLRKQIILVLNKIDLAPAPLVVAWKCYFEEKYPNVHIIMFTSFPEYNLRKVKTEEKGLNIRRRRGKMRMTVEGAQQVYKACQHIVKDAIDLSSWEKKISEEASTLNEENIVSDDDDNSDNDDVAAVAAAEESTSEQIQEETDFNYEEHELYKNGILTIGCVGFPNVGKSSLLNALMGRKVVSVSRTPGHTKHFQTIFLTNSVRLCDCPGLVFPSSAPRTLQVLLGSYPIAQLRVPVASVKYLAERVNLVELLKLHHLNDGDDAHSTKCSNIKWTTFEICEAWALKRGFLTPKAARPDASRAANNILRMALDGQIAMCLLPPGYNKRQDFWMHHTSLDEVKQIQALGKLENADKQEIATGTNYDEEATNETDLSDRESSNDDDDDDVPLPKIQNAFALLSTD